MNRIFFITILCLTLSVPTQQQGRRAPPSQSSPQSSQQNVANRRGQSPPPQSPGPGSGRGQPRPKEEEEEDLDPDAERDDVPKFKCPKADGLYADPSSCKKFNLCGSWRSWTQSCPPSLYFDDKLKYCTFKTPQLTCGPVSEEEVREEEAQTNQDGIPNCDRSRCQLPNCYCSEEGTEVPGNLASTQIPQMVLISFSGAVNELVFEQYKKTLGYTSKFSTQQTRVNPNGCGIRGTFFINHEYTNYAEVQWLAAQGHEIAMHTITHRLPEVWWTDRANYSDWAEEMIGIREIILAYAGQNNALTRDNLIGMRAPYIKPGGDVMFEMAHDFGLLYDSSIVAPRGVPPYWPYTLDYRQAFDCSNSNKKEKKEAAADGGEQFNANIRFNRDRQKRETKMVKIGNVKKSVQNEKKSPKSSQLIKSRVKRQFLGRALKCPTKQFPGLWEVPINPLYNEFNTCHHADQCVFPNNDEGSTDIFDFLVENFERHYNTNRAPFQLNFHVTWFTSKTHIRALNRFIDHVNRSYPDTWFVTFQQMISWMKNPQPVNQLNFGCENRNASLCNRPHTCVLKHYLDKDNSATTIEGSVRTDTRYMQLCHSVSCPQQYPWFGNYAGRNKDFRSIMQLVEEAVGSSPSAN